MEPEIASCSSTLTSNKGVTQGDNDVEHYVMQNGGVDNKNKGKAIQLESPSYDEQYEGSPSDSYDAMNNIDSYPGSSPMSNSLLDPDSLIYEDDDDYSDYSYDMEEEQEQEEPDEYSMYQHLFDGKDIPSGVEVSMDWFPDSSDKETAKPSGSNKSSRDEHGIPSEEASSSSSSHKKAAKVSGVQSQTSCFPAPVAQPWKDLPHNSKGVIPSSAYALPQKIKTAQSVVHFNNQPQATDTVIGEAPVQAQGSSVFFLPKQKKTTGFKGFKSVRPKVEEVLAASDASRVKRNMEEYLGKYLFFKRFDIVEDFDDHQYASMGTTSKQHSKEWAKRIQEEWRILENDLPEMIFVRAYESRMDLLRAVIIGADGTPYHDGLFFFDIYFPDTYPSVPPVVHYQSGGLRINPNLYNCGKVCLSLLGTWSGSQKEKWLPDKSTMLQVLVSIQGLILNQNPYFNEPGYENTAGSPSGDRQSKAYSENTFLLSLKTMVYNMRRPPKYFEDFSYGHFFSCAHNVLKACDAYRNGAPVASLVKGVVKGAVEENSAMASSLNFRTNVATFVETVLLNEFILLGVLGLEDKPSETDEVAENSNGNTRSSKGDGVSSS